MTYEKNQLIYRIQLRTPNTDSVFLYYILEAWGHLCFYSTLSFLEGQQYRDVIAQCTIEMKPLLQAVIEDLMEEIPLELISEKDILDQ